MACQYFVCCGIKIDLALVMMVHPLRGDSMQVTMSEHGCNCAVSMPSSWYGEFNDALAEYRASIKPKDGWYLVRDTLGVEHLRYCQDGELRTVNGHVDSKSVSGYCSYRPFTIGAPKRIAPNAANRSVS